MAEESHSCHHKFCPVLCSLPAVDLIHTASFPQMRMGYNNTQTRLNYKTQKKPGKDLLTRNQDVFLNNWKTANHEKL